MSITAYKNLAQIPSVTPTGPGGLAIYQTSKNLADRFGQIFAGGFNVLDYGASGSAVTTTGTVSSSSTSLVVASASSFAIGQGILIKGAGTAGAHHVTVIDNIVGTTITLHVAAVTGVTGAVVQHDDTAAINAALAAAFNAGGGDVFVPSGYYRTNGPYTAATNSILTLPQTQLGNVSGSLWRVGLIGQVRGTVSVVGGSFAYQGGTCFDCIDAPTPSGTAPAWFSAAPYVQQAGGFTPAVWNPTSPHFQDFTVLFGASPALSGIMLSNSMQGEINDNVLLAAKLTSGLPTTPGAGSIGFRLPQTQNNVLTVKVGNSQALGFDYGIYGSENLILDRPYINYCNVGLGIPFGYSPVRGELSVGLCPLMISRTESGNAYIDLFLGGETIVDGHWYDKGSPWGLSDPSDVLKGYLRYHVLDPSGTGVGSNLSVTGGANMHLVNIDT